MSKMDGLRALREASYEQAVARAASNRGRTAQQAAPVAGPAAVEDPTADPTASACGHRSINGRSCTREHGHAARSHRYS